MYTLYFASKNKDENQNHQLSAKQYGQSGKAVK